MERFKRYAWGVVNKDGEYELNTAIEVELKNIQDYAARANKYPKHFPNGPYRVVELFYKVSD